MRALFFIISINLCLFADVDSISPAQQQMLLQKVKQTKKLELTKARDSLKQTKSLRKRAVMRNRLRKSGFKNIKMVKKRLRHQAR